MGSKSCPHPAWGGAGEEGGAESGGECSVFYLHLLSMKHVLGLCYLLGLWRQKGTAFTLRQFTL